mmetsp:Transcript_19498/g.24076  ORF Transcript_19498/g.24076 Transcript_19498/m.24076 type:complete len:416 (-) Transcript_19498:738-1985(-)
MSTNLSVFESKYNYQFRCNIKEDHKSPIYGIKFFPFNGNFNIFGTVGDRRLTIYKCNDSGEIKCIQMYVDEAWDEVLYTLTWCIDKITNAPLIAIAGKLGIIKILNCNNQSLKCVIKAHGNVINNMSTFNRRNDIIISCSDDESIKIWNIQTELCIAILCGHSAHRSGVLNVNIHLNNQLIISTAKDRAINIWYIANIDKIIKRSYKIKSRPENVKSKRYHKKYKDTIFIQYPIYSRQKLHNNYIDCVQFFGDIVFSKSTESRIKIWKFPDKISDIINKDKSRNTCNNEIYNIYDSPETIGELRYEYGTNWSVKFDINYKKQLICVGNANSQIYLWDLNEYFRSKYVLDLDKNGVHSPDNIILNNNEYKPTIINLPMKTNETDSIRDVSISQNGTIIVCATEKGMIYRFDTNKYS